jgi:DNA polymerase-3 subunit delta
MIYLFLECDEFLATEDIRGLKAALGDAELADLNITEMEGAQARAGEILGQAAMMPFLAPRRLILVRGYLAQLDKRMAASKNTDAAAYAEAAQFLIGLGEVSDSTDLLLVDSGVDKRRGLWKGFSLKQDGKERAIPGLQALIQAKTVTRMDLPTPDAKSLPGWLQARAKSRGIALDGRALQLLATYVGPNLRQLDNELEKLSLYAGARPMTDALSQRNPRAAMTALHALRRNDAHPIYLLTMIARQYRVMLKVKDALGGRASGNEHDIAPLVGEKPYPVKKAMGQAAAYTFDELVDVLDRLVMADYAMKTGADAEAELDILIAELTQRPARIPGRTPGRIPAR